MTHNDKMACLNKAEYEQNGYTISQNANGVVNIFDGNGNPTTDHESKSCCEALGYNFNIDTQKCMWGSLDGNNDSGGTLISSDCVFEPFRVVLNPEGNGGTIFETDDNETCCLSVEFDYIFNFDCDVLESFIIGGLTPNEVNSEENTSASIENLISEKELEYATIEGLITAENALNIPYVIECYETNSKYCLTEDGLTGWRSIIGTTNYNTWLESLGVNTNTYTCGNVTSLGSATGMILPWYTESCDYSIFDKTESNNRLISYHEQLNILRNEIIKLNDELVEVNESINSVTTCQTYIDIFEGLDVSFNLEILNSDTGTLETVYSETIFELGENTLSDYIVNNYGSTGLLIEGDCSNMKPTIQGELNEQYQNNNNTISEDVSKIFNDWFNTCWLRYEREICDPNIINSLTNENINISLLINNSCVDFSILLDRVKINKKCEKVENVETFISEPPVFEFERNSDNKKSWVANKGRVERDFELKYRGTEYFSNEQRLTINTKEIDLNLSPARAVEQDVWCYINDNTKLLGSCDNNDPFEPFYCPDGYDFDNGDVNVCIKSGVTSTISVGNIYSAETAYNFNRVNHYGIRGTIFIEDDITNLEWPIYWTGTPMNTWVGPYYNVDYLTDSTGNTINATGFGVEYKQGNLLRWSSPPAFSGFYSQFGASESLMVNDLPNPNLLWGGTPGLNTMVLAGRLFNAGIWVKGTGTNNEFFENKWVGLSECLELNVSGTYHIGFAGDDKVRVKINGKWLVNPDISPTRAIGIDSGFDTFRPNTRFTQSYVVAPITLFKGKNVIEVEGYNGTAGAPSGFAMEIYSGVTTNELKSLRTESELDDVTAFSTKWFIGEELNVVGDEGYFCPVNYALDTCLPEPFQCLQITRVPSIEVEQEICCCEGDPVVIDGFEGTPIQLPLTSSGVTLECDDIYNTYTGTSSIEVFESECRSYYRVGDKLPNSFDGYLITQENDGGVGVYEANWNKGVNEDYVSLTDQVGSECCNIISSMFDGDRELNHQGVDVYPNITWDTNLKKCVYRKCGDDACVNLDDLLTTEIIEFDTLSEFTKTLNSELIDVKNRQTISTYPTLKMLYERYNYRAMDFSDTNSSKFDYFDMDKFGRTVGDYWVDLIEQVIPATSIWNSTYEYRNTVFDQQKFQYKRTSLFNCTNPSSDYPMSPIGNESGVEVILETLNTSNTSVSNLDECSGVWIMQNTSGAEYFGSVSILGNPSQVGGQNTKTISEISTLDAQ